jgi:hypothetical protein
VKYWKDIEAGRLSRNSFVSRYLLYSVEVALDKATELEGMQDWKCIEEELDQNQIFVIMVYYIGKMMKSSKILRLLYQHEARREERAIHLLTSFIEAHEQAQIKLHSYGGIYENGDEKEDISMTKEESMVRDESIATVCSLFYYLIFIDIYNII